MLFVNTVFSTTYAPNQKAGMVTVSMDEESLQNLLAAYDNAGYHDLKLTQKLDEVNEIKKINELYFHNFQIKLEENDISLQLEGVVDANLRVVKGIPFHPHVKTSGIDASANVFLYDFNVSNDEKVHLNICLSGVDTEMSNISYGYGFIADKILAKAFADDYANSIVQSKVDAAIKLESGGTDCIDITDYVAISYPKFLAPIGLQHTGSDVKDGEILAYGCPVEKNTVGNEIAVGNGPCETVDYKITIHTAEDIGNAGTNSKITMSLCGDDIFGMPRCFKENIDGKTGMGDKSFLKIESPYVLVKNLSVNLESDNSGKKPGWYVDSVSVNMKLPNNSVSHYWFPIHNWIGGDDAPTSYTFRQNDNIQVYTFSVETGNRSHFDHAGTNSYIVAEVCDIKDKCIAFELDKDGHDDFEAGSNTTYTIMTNETLSNIKSLTLHNVYDGKHPGWYVQDVMYKHYSFPENIDHSLKDGQGFMFRQWLASGELGGAYYTFDKWYFPRSNDDGILYPVNSSVIIPIEDIYASRYVNDNFGYDIVIKTKDGNHGDPYGTDADIILTIEGCSGESELFNLNDDVNNFERGSLDEFRVSTTKNLKGIKKISIYNKGGGAGPGWNPESIVIIPESYRGEYKDVYAENPETGKKIGIYNEPFSHTFTTNIGPKETWTSPENTGCSDILETFLNPYIYETHPGAYVQIIGANLDNAQNIEVNLDKKIAPELITRDYALFHIPENTPLGDYDWGAVVLNGTVQSVFIHVRGEKPVLDGIAISTAEPGEAFEASMRNISASSKFYLGDILLKTLSLSNKSVFLQIPRNMENGIYRFRVESNGWDIMYDETIEIVKSIVPHIASISDMIVYTGQVVEITGKNFGDDLKSMKVVVGDKEAEIKSLKNEKISIRIPSGVSGKNVAIQVIRENVPAPEILTVEIKGIPWFMSFDDPERLWTSDNADLSYDDIVKYENIGYSLKIHGDGYKSIVSPVFNTYEIEAFSRELQLDVWIPEDQINPYWYGDVQMSVNIPAAGLYNAWVGQVLLTGLQTGWNTLSFELNQDIYNAIAGDYPNATITIILNTNQNPDDFRIDNLRFGGDLNLRSTEHVIAGNVLDIYSADFMSFDNINDWIVNNRDLLFVESPRTQGLGAAGLVASGYTEIKSRSFALSELKFVSNIISLDVYVPNPQPNDYWVGDIGLNLSCPDLGINSMYLGNVNLTHMFREEFNNIQFTIPEEVVMNLRYGIGECSFSIYLNVNNGAGTFLLDNMGFVNVLEVAGR